MVTIEKSWGARCTKEMWKNSNMFMEFRSCLYKHIQENLPGIRLSPGLNRQNFK
jgi:hypothetical protein